MLYSQQISTSGQLLEHDSNYTTIAMVESLYLQYLFGGFVSLIVITNPLSKIPLYISLTQGMSIAERKKQANWACYYAAAIMLVSLAAGNLLLVFFGISYGALRISGGFVVGLIGYQMLFGSRDQQGAPVVRRDKTDYSFFPLAMPGISGPGTIAVVIGIASEIAELPNWIDMAGAFFMTGVSILACSFITWIVLRCSEYISSKLGPSGTQVLTKLMGFLLICIGVQFMGSGVRTFMAGS